MFGKLHVAPIVHQFLLAYPDVSVRLLLSDGVLDIIEQHVDVAIRIGRLPDSSLVARRAGEISWMVVGAPDYLARRGHPRSVADIAHHDCIAFEGRERGREWPFLVDGKPTITVIKPRFSVNTADAVIDGAAAGLGLACLMSYQTAKSVRDGTLLPVLLKHQPPPIPVHVVHAAQALPPLKLRAFLDFVTPRLTKTLTAVKDSFTPRRSQRQK
jgi:DNA-binding transcriptional LysR family regulator